MLISRCEKEETTVDGIRFRETQASLRFPNVSSNLYSTMSVLNKRARDALSQVILPWAQFFIILIPASCNYVLIRSHDQLNIITLVCVASLSLVIMAICTLAYPVAASIFSLSTAYLNSFKKPHIAPGLTRVQQKRIKSFKPIKVQVGGLMFIRPFTVLKLINSIIYWTMRALLIK